MITPLTSKLEARTNSTRLSPVLGSREIPVATFAVPRTFGPYIRSPYSLGAESGRVAHLEVALFPTIYTPKMTFCKVSYIIVMPVALFWRHGTRQIAAFKG